MQEDVFNSFIWKSKIDYRRKCDLIKKIEDNYLKKQNRTPNKWKCQLHSSFDFKESFDHKIPEDLLRLFENKINEFLNSCMEKIQVKGEFYILECWYNAYNGNQFQEPHHHGNSLFSGCYYLKFNDKKHHQTKFYNPNFSIDFYKIKDNPYFCYTPDCTEDDLIIFPSNLIHETNGVKDVNNCDELRITISFNIANSYLLKEGKKYLKYQ